MMIMAKYYIMLVTVIICMIGVLLIAKGVLTVFSDGDGIGIIGILLGIGIFIISCLSGYHYSIVANNDEAKLAYEIKDIAISSQDAFFNNEAEICLNKVQNAGYLTDNIRIELKHDLADNNFNLRELKIEGSSENDRSNTVYIKITYDGKSYFKSGKKLGAN